MSANSAGSMVISENEQLEQLIQAAEQIADDDPRLVQARELIRLRVLFKLRKTYPELDLANCAQVVATVLKNFSNLMQWEGDEGVRIANDHPALREALVSELRMLM
ncbi:hypothetical protein [Reyranella soli]|uniref:Uncharacterized protein n=1 Tax=Reyranella soli TaxID=1230389 RepID=A0A512NRR9_9HYPH|nr:hypothetical protein [Reyranella soli]GEP61645.1 hypothetical protein RSO01_88110 [Reyranella soli]